MLVSVVTRMVQMSIPIELHMNCKSLNHDEGLASVGEGKKTPTTS